MKQTVEYILVNDRGMESGLEPHDFSVILTPDQRAAAERDGVKAILDVITTDRDSALAYRAKKISAQTSRGWRLTKCVDLFDVMTDADLVEFHITVNGEWDADAWEAENLVPAG